MKKAENLRLSRQSQRAPVTDEETHFALSEFSIYRPRTSSPNNPWNKTAYDLELVPLNHLKTNRGCDQFLFDGLLQVGNSRRYVKAIPFNILATDGYGDLNKSTTTSWIQSTSAATARVWYRLQEPSIEYQRYHEAFQWVATFAKHFVDFCSRKDNVCLRSFQKDFYTWIRDIHGGCRVFQRWLRQYPQTDFRTVVTAHTEYLWKEATDVNSELRRLKIWRECDPRQLNAIPLQLSTNLKNTASSKTIVTEFVYNCFRETYFAQVLQIFDPEKAATTKAHRNRCRELKFLDYQPSDLKPKNPNILRSGEIQTGDVVCVPRDTETAWRDKAEMWFAYVQKIRNDGGQAILDVLWLYRPTDTTLGNQSYPFCNELFLSDHCNCHSDNLYASDIIGKIDVRWSPTSIPNEYFVRQTYQTEDQSFVTLRRSHFYCEHTSSTQTTKIDSIRAMYRMGDTVLALAYRNSQPILEPCVIQRHLNNEKTRVRKLLRRKRDFQDYTSKENELVWTDDIVEIPTKNICRICQIRFFSHKSKPPTPYDREGQVDCFFISSRKVSGQSGSNLKELSEPFPEGMNIGFDPSERLKYPPLDMLSLFSGGGNFDRGLEEGGALNTRWTVEWDRVALHTYKANCKDGHLPAFFLGPVDEYLHRAMSGNDSSLIAKIGEVLAIAAGNPCKGFSKLQRDTYSDESILNASKVASVASFIDHYRPIYAILENVPEMGRNLGKQKPQNVLSQLLCTLVGMGYQVRQYLLNAWSYGNPQSRRRLFITIAAPHFTPIAHPPLTHSDPAEIAGHSLGQLVNGERFGVARSEITPFDFVSAREATKDLPDIGDAHVRVCIPYPDHRLSIGGAPINRLISSVIPTFPRSQNLRKVMMAARNGSILPLPRRVVQYFTERSETCRKYKNKSWGRANPDGLFPTIITRIDPADAIVGQSSLHWEEPRPLSIMDARRAQGVPDSEVILGWPSAQLEINGNGVARAPALCMGMGLREAWLTNSPQLVTRATKNLIAITSTVISNAYPNPVSAATERPPSPEVVIPVGQFHLEQRLVHGLD